MKIVIFDLDGTLALCEHRQHLIPAKEDSWEDKAVKWNAFFDACDLDTPNEKVVELYRTLQNAGYVMCILSGRSNRVYDKTIAWFKQHNIEIDWFRMREEGDVRRDDIIKPLMLDELIRDMSRSYYGQPSHTAYHIIKDAIQFIVDDRASVVKVWRDLGFTVLQVADGNF